MRELKDLNEASPKLVQQSFKAEEDLKSKLIEMDTKELTLSEKTRDATAKLNVQRLSVCPSISSLHDIYIYFVFKSYDHYHS